MSCLVLIVDDDAVAREAIRALLEYENYRLDTATSGREAIEKAIADSPDVILLDVMMPEMDGFEVCRQIRSIPLIAEIPIIFLTALDDQNSYLQGLEAGADDFLTKPINRHELRARVGNITRLNRYHVLLKERARSRELTHRLINLQEEERKKIAQEIHDEIGQSLTTLNIGLNLLFNDLSEEQTETKNRVSDMIVRVKTTIDQLHSLGDGLRPPSLDTVGLVPTLQGYCRDFSRRTELPVLFSSAEHFPVLPEPYNITLYRFLQEALNNIVKHARASQVWVKLRTEGDRISLSVRDDGRGFPTHLSGELEKPIDREDGSQGMGLQGMRERVTLLNGQVEVDAQPKQGSRVTAWLPCLGE